MAVEITKKKVNKLKNIKQSTFEMNRLILPLILVTNNNKIWNEV